MCSFCLARLPLFYCLLRKVIQVLLQLKSFIQKKLVASKKNMRTSHLGAIVFFLFGAPPKQSGSILLHVVFPWHCSKQKKIPWTNQPKVQMEKNDVLLTKVLWCYCHGHVGLGKGRGSFCQGRKFFFSQNLGDSLTQLSQGRCGPRRKNKGDIVETQSEKFQKDLASPIFLVESDRNIKR